MSEALAIRGLTPQSIQEVGALADRLAQARGFVPNALLNNPGAIAACILTGLELGIGPMQALRSIHVLDGRPMLSADLMLALAIRGGVRQQWLESTEETARVRLTREGFEPHEHAFTMAEAKAAGLAGRNNWKKYPAAMLRARCLSAALRAFAPDVLGAGVYVEGEIDAGYAHDVVDVPDPAEESARKMAKMKAKLLALHAEDSVTEDVMSKAIAFAAEHGVSEGTVRGWLPAKSDDEDDGPPAVFPDLATGAVSANALLRLGEAKTAAEAIGVVQANASTLAALPAALVETAFAEHSERLEMPKDALVTALGGGV